MENIIIRLEIEAEASGNAHLARVCRKALLGNRSALKRIQDYLWRQARTQEEA